MGNAAGFRWAKLALFVLLLGTIAVVSALGAASALATQGPIAAYSFDAGEGTVAEDLTGNGHEGTIKGAEWTSGKYSSALNFNGESSCLSTPNAEDLQLFEEFTVEAWVKPAGSGESEPILLKETPGWFGYSLFFGLDEAAKLEGYLGEAGSITRGTQDPALAEPHVWTHIALSFDGARMRLYIDGEQVDGSAANGPLATTGSLSIGCSQAGEEFFKGKIDEVRIYNRALDAGEIGADMSTGLQTPPAGPVAAYAFDENEGTVAHDFAGGHDGTIEGAKWTRGKFGSALEFNSTEEDVVTIPTSPDLNLEDFTLEAWVKPSKIHPFEPVIAKTDSAPEAYGYELMAGGDEESALPEGFITQGEYVDRYTYSEEQLDRNAWTHLAVSSDGAKLRFYVDGKLVDTRTGDNVLAGSEGPLQIGGNKAWGSFFNGKIDEVRLYDRALSEGEITIDAHSGIETPQAGPIAAYSFDKGEGTVAEDLTGNGHEGTIEGAEWTSGKYGGALEFDGEEEDVVTIPTSPDLNLEEFTLEAWVRPSKIHQFEPVIAKVDPAPEAYGYELMASGEEPSALPAGFITQGEYVDRYTYSEEQLDLHAWTHLAVTSDGAKLRFYVNGKLVDTRTGDNVLAGSEAPLQIGGNSSFAPASFFDGKIDEVRIYNRALDTQEVGGDMNAALQTPPAGPVAAYAFDENEGTTAHDYAGGHDGTIEGAKWTRGRFGSALEFNAAEEDVVTIPTSSGLNLEDFTLEAWVKPSKIHQYEPVIAKVDPAPEAYGYELLAGGEEPTVVPAGFITQGEYVDRYTYSEEQLDTHAWAHLAVTSDGAKLRFYVNGKLVDTRTGDNVLAGSEAPLQIGGNNSFAPASFFDGRIDEVRIYNRALSEGEITTDAHSGIETPQQGPIAAYSFDQGEGGTVEDITGNGHEGTIEGATWSTRGKYGSALEFDGENDCVRVPESAELAFLENEEFTLEAWVRPTGENIEAIVTQEDESGAEWEEPFSYSMLYGGTEEAPKGWLRKGGESGHLGVSGGESIPQRTWSHVAFTDDGAHLRLYVDGELRGTQPAIPLTAAKGPLTIGCLANYGNYFDGKIDEVRIYNRALDAAEAADIAPPVFESEPRIFAVYPPGAAQPAVLLPLAHDPTLPDGAPGSGLDFYRYRFALGSGEFAPWAEASSAWFAIPAATVGQTITVEVIAFDKVSNRSFPVRSSDTVPAEEHGEEVEMISEEEQDEEEENREEFEGTQGKTTSYPGSSSAEGVSSLIAETPIECDNFHGWPHRSTHKKTRINAVEEIDCETGPVEGLVRKILFRDGRIVADSGERLFFFGELGGAKAAYANSPCIKGSKWRAWGFIYKKYPPTYEPPEQSEEHYSPLRSISCRYP